MQAVAVVQALVALRALVLTLLVGLPLMTVPVSALQLPVQAEITEVGVYESLGEEIIVAAPRTAMGIMSQVEGFRLLFPATTLEAAKGATFGFRYQLVGVPDGIIDGLELRIEHPPIVGGFGPSETESVMDALAFGVNGVAEGTIIYSLDEANEIVPGRWTLEVVLRGRALVSQVFLLQ